MCCQVQPIVADARCKLDHRPVGAPDAPLDHLLVRVPRQPEEIVDRVAVEPRELSRAPRVPEGMFAVVVVDSLASQPLHHLAA
eukprot:2787820-Prymnesium_polylepis.2